jgi:poly(glycerol-phosphate) alpha-glucosyltransferase
MTSAMLHRSRAFVRLGGAEVDVLTFDPDPGYPARERRMRADGELVQGMRLLNLWDWLREHELPGGSLRLGRHPFTPLAELPPREGERIAERLRDGIVMSRVRYAEDGTTILQSDHFRSDGSLLASERRDTRQRGVSGGKSVVLCDRDGAPVRSWGRIAHLYEAWLDRLAEGRPSYLIVDSKTVAQWAIDYHRPHATVLHLVHASHLVGRTRPMGTLRPSRKKVFENLSGFDSVVLLTERQRDDVQELLGRQRNLAVIPNSRDLPAAPPLSGRDPGAGVMLASLISRKRPAHAVRAVQAVRERGVDARLDLWGEGEERAQLMELAQGDGSAIRLHGHVPGAASRLVEASFLLSTSTSEGLPLVLVESLAAGCIPIAYDVPYGPADIIRDGVNGFLVPGGDQEALAAAIERLVTMPEKDRERMRRAAVTSARRFTDEAVTAQWARELRRARRRARRRALPLPRSAS